ncbi:MAG: C2 family cysteine protease [archaeon]|nr:C2 family cysteine protease [archaeon]
MKKSKKKSKKAKEEPQEEQPPAEEEQPKEAEEAEIGDAQQKESVSENQKADAQSAMSKKSKKSKKSQKESVKGSVISGTGHKEQIQLQKLINPDNIKTYWKNQIPNEPGNKFIDQIFPPITESLLDKKVKTEGVDKINIMEIDWKKAKEIFGTNLVLFPGQDKKKTKKKKEKTEKEGEEENIPKEENEEEGKEKELNEENAEIPEADKKSEISETKSDELIINYTENKGILFDSYSQFFQAINIMKDIPGLIQQIFKTKEINQDGYYELYIYTNGEFKTLILDDFFPIIKGSVTLRFAKPNKNELWLMLLEKAYAKVNGGYASLMTSTVSSVLKTFLGFPCEKLNVFDIDLEDLEQSIRIHKGTNWIFSIPNEKGEEKGLIKGKGYELLDIYDIRTKDENGKEKCLKLIKLRNEFNSGKYSGDFSNSSTSWNEDIKRVVDYKDEEKESIIYITLDDFYLYFNTLEILSLMYDSNIKLLKICNNDKETDKIMMPQCFNLYVPKTSKVSMSIVLKNKLLDIETTEYDYDLTTYNYCVPSCICYSKFDAQNQKFKGFEGGFSSKNGTEFTRELEEGFYVIWTFILYEKCNDPKPEEYYLKIASPNLFKVRFQCTDYKYHLIRELVHSAILQYQGSFIKSDEIYTMNDSYYNLTGLGLKIIINPFEDCYQKWEFQPELENMSMLYPYNKIPQFEGEVPPKGFFIMLALKVNESEKCNFDVKYHFRTLKYNAEEKKETFTFTFNEFCSEDVKQEKYSSTYFNFVNEESLKEIHSAQENPEEGKEEKKEEGENEGEALDKNKSIEVPNEEEAPKEEQPAQEEEAPKEEQPAQEEEAPKEEAPKEDKSENEGAAPKTKKKKKKKS